MSISKHLLFDPDFDPEFAQRQREAVVATIDAHPHRMPIRRKNKVASGPRWDALWEGAIGSAATELGVSCIRVNDGMYFQQSVDRDRVRARAEELWQERHAHYVALLRR